MVGRVWSMTYGWARVAWDVTHGWARVVYGWAHVGWMQWDGWWCRNVFKAKTNPGKMANAEQSKLLVLNRVAMLLSKVDGINILTAGGTRITMTPHLGATEENITLEIEGVHVKVGVYANSQILYVIVNGDENEINTEKSEWFHFKNKDDPRRWSISEYPANLIFDPGNVFFHVETGDNQPKDKSLKLFFYRIIGSRDDALFELFKVHLN